METAFKGTFSGDNQYSISKLTNCVFNYIDDGANISGLKVYGSTISKSCGIIVDNMLGGTIFDCTVKGGGIFDFNNGSYASGIVGNGTNGTITNCNALNLGLFATNMGAIVGNGSINVSGCKFASIKDLLGNPISNIGGNPIEGTNTQYFELKTDNGVIATCTNTETHEITIDGDKFYTSGATFNVTVDKTATGYEKITEITNVTADGDAYTLTLTGDTAITLNGYPKIAGLNFNADENYYEISSAANLQTFASYVNAENDCEGLIFKQTADIDLNTIENFTTIGYYENSGDWRSFSGTFDGCGYKISNLKINSGDERVGLFGNVDGGTIQNVNLENATVTDTGNNENYTYAGALVGLLRGKVENCSISGNISVSGDDIGGLVGKLNIDGIISGILIDVATLTLTKKYNAGTVLGGVVDSQRYTVSNIYYHNFTGEVIGIGGTATPINVYALNLPENVEISVDDDDKVTLGGENYYKDGAAVTIGGQNFKISSNSEFVTANYVDNGGTTQNCYAITITNATTSLSGGWYVVNGNINLELLKIRGDVHLILADGAKLTVNGGDDYGIYCAEGVDGFGGTTPASLEIFGQSLGSGELNISNTATDKAAVQFESGCNLTINGGKITATSENYRAMYISDDLTINGGKITAESNGGGGYDINAKNLTLGYRNSDDFISANSFSVTNSVTIKSGQRFYDDSGNVYSGTLTSEQLSYLAAHEGTTFKPLSGYVVTIPDYVTIESGTATQIGETDKYICAAGEELTLSTKTGYVVDDSITINKDETITASLDTANHYVFDNGNGYTLATAENTTNYPDLTQVYALNLPENVTASGEIVTIDNGTTYAVGDVTFSGIKSGYVINSANISADTTITATLDPDTSKYYVFGNENDGYTLATAENTTDYPDLTQVYALNLPENVTASGEIVTIDNGTTYAVGNVTFSGVKSGYVINSANISADMTINATLDPDTSKHYVIDNGDGYTLATADNIGDYPNLTQVYKVTLPEGVTVTSDKYAFGNDIYVAANAQVTIEATDANKVIKSATAEGGTLSNGVYTLTATKDLIVSNPILIWDFAKVFASEDGTSDKPYTLDTAAKIGYLTDNITAGEEYSGKYFKLTSDIGSDVKNIGDTSKQFKGTAILGAGVKVSFNDGDLIEVTNGEIIFNVSNSTFDSLNNGDKFKISDTEYTVGENCILQSGKVWLNNPTQFTLTELSTENNWTDTVDGTITLTATSETVYFYGTDGKQVATFDGNKLTKGNSATAITAINASALTTAITINGFYNENTTITAGSGGVNVNVDDNKFSVVNGEFKFDGTKLISGTATLSTANDKVTVEDNLITLTSGDGITVNASDSTIGGLNSGDKFTIGNDSYEVKANGIIKNDNSVHATAESLAINDTSWKSATIIADNAITLGNDTLYIDSTTKQVAKLENGALTAIDTSGAANLTVDVGTGKEYTLGKDFSNLKSGDNSFKVTATGDYKVTGTTITLANVTGIEIDGVNYSIDAEKISKTVENNIYHLTKGDTVTTSDLTGDDWKLHSGTVTVTDSLTTTDGKTLTVADDSDGVTVTVADGAITSITGLISGGSVTYDGKTYKYTLTLPDNVTATGDKLVIDGKNYYATGTTVNFDAGNGKAIKPVTINDSDVTITADDIYYSLTLPADVTASGESYTVNDKTYYKGDVTLTAGTNSAIKSVTGATGTADTTDGSFTFKISDKTDITSAEIYYLVTKNDGFTISGDEYNGYYRGSVTLTAKTGYKFSDETTTRTETISAATDWSNLALNLDSAGHYVFQDGGNYVLATTANTKNYPDLTQAYKVTLKGVTASGNDIYLNDGSDYYVKTGATLTLSTKDGYTVESTATITEDKTISATLDTSKHYIFGTPGNYTLATADNIGDYPDLMQVYKATLPEGVTVTSTKYAVGNDNYVKAGETVTIAAANENKLIKSATVEGGTLENGVYTLTAAKDLAVSEPILIWDFAKVFASEDGTSDKPYTLNTTAKVGYLTDNIAVGEEYSEKYFKLTSGIGSDVKNIGDTSKQFKGTAILGAGVKVSFNGGNLIEVTSGEITFNASNSTFDSLDSGDKFKVGNIEYTVGENCILQSGKVWLNNPAQFTLTELGTENNWTDTVDGTITLTATTETVNFYGTDGKKVASFDGTTLTKGNSATAITAINASALTTAITIDSAFYNSTTEITAGSGGVNVNIGGNKFSVVSGEFKFDGTKLISGTATLSTANDAVKVGNNLITLTSGDGITVNASDSTIGGLNSGDEFTIGSDSYEVATNGIIKNDNSVHATAESLAINDTSWKSATIITGNAITLGNDTLYIDSTAKQIAKLEKRSINGD